MLKRVEFKFISVIILSGFSTILVYLTELNININLKIIVEFILGIIFFIQLVMFINENKSKNILKAINFEKAKYLNFKNIIWAVIGIITPFIFIYFTQWQNILLKIFILIIAIEIMLNSLVNFKFENYSYDKKTIEKRNSLIRTSGRVGNNQVLSTACIRCFFSIWALALVPSEIFHLQKYIFYNSIIIGGICFLVGPAILYFLDCRLKSFVVVECLCTKVGLLGQSGANLVGYNIENIQNKISLNLVLLGYSYYEGDKIIVIMGCLSNFIFDSYREDFTWRLNIDLDISL